MPSYLPLAFVWLVIGVLLLVWHHVNPDAPGRDILGTGLSAGWVAILLTCYNLARWWSIRAGRRASAEALEGRYRAMRARPVQEPDPTFDFSQPPRPDDESRRPKEPS